MTQQLVRFWNDESGPEMVEWAVVTVVLLISTVGAVIALRDGLIDLFDHVFDVIQQDPPDSY